MGHTSVACDLRLNNSCAVTVRGLVTFAVLKMVESDSDIDIKDHDILQQATAVATNSELTAKSAKIYEKAYCHFMDWTRRNKINTFDEYVFIAYFEYLSKDLKSTTLWTRYSTLKSTVSIKHQVDISKYTKLYALLKRKAEGYEAKKSKAFTTKEMKQFIETAPDNKYLLSKVMNNSLFQCIVST